MATAIEQLKAYAVRRGVVRPGVLALVCLLSAGFMTDFAAAPDVTLRVGDLSPHDVVAPISYTFRDQDTTDERQGAAEQRVDPVFEADITALRRRHEFHLVTEPVAAAASNRDAQKLALGLTRDQGRDLAAGRGRELHEVLVARAHALRQRFRRRNLGSGR